MTEIAQTVETMVQGSLSEVTRQCGDPSCACATDPARRHGPHLYLKFNAGGKPYSVYVPPEQGEPERPDGLRLHAFAQFTGADSMKKGQS
ncbi:MAG: hypothetical protein IPM01_29460 [Burkholderiaceae bacterium]|nr:hypothetical protein [Burkholderiaceae bacterium]